MSTVKELVDPKRGTSTLVRPRFSPGLLLQDSDLNTAVDYGRNLTQLLFRHLFGCGVICGYEVSAAVDKCNVLCVTIGRGVALDCKGNPIEVVSSEIIKVAGSCTSSLPGEVWVVIRGREHNSGPRDVSCAPEDNTTTTVCTRICDGYEIRLLAERPECACGCLPKLPPPRTEECCTDPPLRESAEERLDHERPERDSEWEKCGEEERKYRREKMRECAERCDRERRLGVCGCDCCCGWVLLARLHDGKRETNGVAEWQADHTVRRFIRPALSLDYFAHHVRE